MKKNIEIWKDIPGYEGHYQASDQGRIKAPTKTLPHKRYGQYTLKEKLLKPALVTGGYLAVKIDSVNHSVHRLIMLTFEGPSDLQVHHINSIKTDNRFINLRYCTLRQNRIWYWEGENKSSKYVGVCFDKNRNKWISLIYINGKSKHLGRFENEYLAHEAYEKALTELIT